MRKEVNLLPVREKWIRLSKQLEVSDMGNVRTAAGELLPTFSGRGGYLYVELPHRDDTVKVAVHKLILWGFRGKQDVPIKHKNNKRNDNRLDNLEYSGAKAYYQNYRRSRKLSPLRGVSPKATPRRMRKFWQLVQRQVPKAMIAAQLKISLPTVYRWLKLAETPEGKHVLRDPRVEFRGCRDGENCGCRCHRRRGQ